MRDGCLTLTGWCCTFGCGLRIGEALAVNVRCRISQGETLRVRVQVNPAPQLRPLKFRRAGEFRDIPRTAPDFSPRSLTS